MSKLPMSELPMSESPMSELRSEFLFTFTVDVNRLHDVGTPPAGTLHIDLLGGGTVKGPKLNGTVMPGGMDQKRLRADGAMTPNVRLVLETDDNALIYMTYQGIRHGTPEVMRQIAEGIEINQDDLYLRSAAFFETAAAQYDWLNRIVAVGVGWRMPKYAAYDVYQVL